MGQCCQGAAAATAPDEVDPEAAAKVLGALTFKDASDEDMTYASYRSLDPARKATMATAFPELAKASKLLQVTAKKDQAMREFTVTFRGKSLENPQIVMGSCQIMMEDLTPAECIEFCFAEEPNTWAMTQLSQDALESYRDMKFDAWKDMLKSPTCEAQFRRMLQIGMISELFDPQVFPTPASLKASYQVTDERTGKLILLPHPVKGLRVWDAASQSYKTVQTQLSGAPSGDQAQTWWKDFVQDLNSTHGAEYISGLMTGK